MDALTMDSMPGTHPGVFNTPTVPGSEAAFIRMGLNPNASLIESKRANPTIFRYVRLKGGADASQ